MGYKEILHKLIRSGTTLMRSPSDQAPPAPLGSVPPNGKRAETIRLDKEAFSELAQLQQLLPPEQSERYLLEEMSLALEAHALARRVLKLSRVRREELNPRPLSRKTPHQDPSRLSATIDVQELKGRLLRKIEEEQLYLYEDLRLAGLAYELDIEPYQLTRFLNHHLHTTFHDLINRYRIKAAQERLRHAPSETILDIAFAVGFNSKASFNRVFRKATGITPSQYRKSSGAGPDVPKPPL